jgi:antitoxin MazE
MRASIRKMGNSSGIIIPKPVLAEIGAVAGDTMRLSVEGRRIVIEPVTPGPREGWGEDARAIASANDDALVWPEFGNSDDPSLEW